MIDLKSILLTMKKTYTFKVKIANEIKDFDFKNMDTIFKLKGMINRTQPKALPLCLASVNFPRIKDYLGTIYQFDLEFEYPITPSQLVNEISQQMNLDRAYIIVRNEDSPQQKYDEDYLKYNDEDYASSLLDDQHTVSIDVNDFYGDEYNNELVKKLQSKEAKKYQQGFTEVDKNLYNGVK